jgi:hypothetical protein
MRTPRSQRLPKSLFSIIMSKPTLQEVFISGSILLHIFNLNIFLFRHAIPWQPTTFRNGNSKKFFKFTITNNFFGFRSLLIILN